MRSERWRADFADGMARRALDFRKPSERGCEARLFFDRNEVDLALESIHAGNDHHQLIAEAEALF